MKDLNVNLCKRLDLHHHRRFTFQPGSESAEPDVENCQVIGFAKGNNINEAFENLIAENKYLLKTSFDEITGYELRHHNYQKSSKIFCLSERREAAEG